MTSSSMPAAVARPQKARSVAQMVRGALVVSSVWHSPGSSPTSPQCMASASTASTAARLTASLATPSGQVSHVMGSDKLGVPLDAHCSAVTSRHGV